MPPNVEVPPQMVDCGADSEIFIGMRTASYTDQVVKAVACESPSLVFPADVVVSETKIKDIERSNSFGSEPTTASSTGDGVETVFDHNDSVFPASKLGGELSISAIDERYNEILKGARRLSYIAFVLSVLQGSVAIGLGISWSMISLTAMGAQVCIDLVSSVFVVWRFWSRSGGVRKHPRHADPHTRAREAIREKRAALGVGVLLVTTSTWASGWSFAKVFRVPPASHVRMTRALVALSVSWPAFLIFSVVGLMKWTFAIRLSSRVLVKDATTTSFGAALSFITALFASIDYVVSGVSGAANTGAADAVAALIISALILFEGIRTIYQNTLGWVPPSGVTEETIAQYKMKVKAGVQ